MGPLMTERILAKLISETNDFDVLMGRGKGTNNRPGNIHFRQLALDRLCDFEASKSSVRNKEIAKEIIDLIEQKGGRFLRPVTATDTKGQVVAGWEVVSEEAKLTKVKQAMRDSSSSRKKRVQKQNSDHQSNRQWPGLSLDQGTRRYQVADGPARVQSHHQEYPVDLVGQDRNRHHPMSLSTLEYQVGPSTSYNTHPDGVASLPHCLSSVSTTPSAVLMQAHQQRVQVQEEFARYQQEQRDLAQYQQQIGSLFSLQTSRMMAPHPLTDPYSQAVSMNATRLNLLHASLQQGASRDVRAPHHFLGSPSRKRNAQEINQDAADGDRKIKATKGLSTLQPAASVEPFGGTLYRSHLLSGAVPTGREHSLPVMNVSTMSQRTAGVEGKRSNTPGSQTSSSASSVSTETERSE